MTKLSTVDGLFLRVESRELPMHVAGLQIFQLPKGKGSNWLQELLQDMRSRRPGVPFNQRLEQGMFGRMQLVEDKEFEIDYHVRHNVLPKPGSDEQLGAAVARMHSNLLDRDRPLWEFHLIEGLSNRRFAFYIKIHHAICDGATFSKWMAESTDSSPKGRVRAIWERSHRPSSYAANPLLKILQSPGEALRKSAELGFGLSRYTAQMLKERIIEGNELVALPMSGSQTALNAHLSASRNLAFTQAPLKELKAMGKKVGGTLNDVVLAICDAALRRYLGEQGEEPEKPLLAAVPVNIRKEGDASEGNFVTSLLVKLGNRQQGPEERLRTVSESVKTARAVCEDVPAVATQFVSFGSGLLGAAGSALRLEGIMPPPLNLVISNVRGPTGVRYFAGAKLLATYPISGIAPMTVLNVTVYSYNDTVFFGLVSGRRALPHLRDLKLCLDEIYEEYAAALLKG